MNTTIETQKPSNDTPTESAMTTRTHIFLLALAALTLTLGACALEPLQEIEGEQSASADCTFDADCGLGFACADNGQCVDLAQDGVDGHDGRTPLVNTTRFSGDVCESLSGLYVVHYFDDDGVDGPSEGDTIISEGYICDGVDGEDGTSCTVTSPQPGVYTQVCGDGSSVTWRDGETGPQGSAGQDGSNGTNGQDGSSCSVVDNGDGTATMSCTDGTSVTWRTEPTIVVEPTPECHVDNDCPGEVTYECLAEDGTAAITAPICFDNGTCGFAGGEAYRAACVVAQAAWSVEIVVVDYGARDIEPHVFYEPSSDDDVGMLAERLGDDAMASFTFDQMQACTWGMELAARNYTASSTGPWMTCNAADAGAGQLSELVIFVNGEEVTPSWIFHDHVCAGNAPQYYFSPEQLGCP